MPNQFAGVFTFDLFDMLILIPGVHYFSFKTRRRLNFFFCTSDYIVPYCCTYNGNTKLINYIKIKLIILNKRSLFVRVYKLKAKFCCLTIRNSNKNKILREVSSCLTEKFNGFCVVPIEQEKKITKKFRRVYIIYKPIKKCNKLIECYYSRCLNFGFRGKFTEGNQTKIKFCTTWQYYYCSNYYGRKDKFERQIENCASQPGTCTILIPKI